MTDGHCFISYSTSDGVDFLQNLVRELEGGTPYIPAWYDTRNIPPGTNWDDEIVDAIKTCKCMLFVMSADSTKSSSDCRKEILFALRYKKPIIPLLIHKNAEPIFMIATREWIDFSDFNVGLGKLRKYIQELDLPVGQLRLLKERISDAEHDLRRATGEEAERIKTEIEELNKEFDAQKKIADNPQAAQEQTQKNIEAGLERERQPQMPLVGIKSSKFINPPPGIAPNYFQDRTVETKQVFDFLKDDAQRLLTIVGRGGVGKTAMVCRLLKYLENSAIPEDVQKAFSDLKPIKVDGIVYLSESGSHRVNFANIFYDLCKLLPKETVQELDAIYKNPQGSTESKLRALLENFTGDPIVLLLDNFEPLVDSETFEIKDAELNEALLAFLNGTHTAVNIVITTRVAPKKLNLVQPGRQRPLDLDDGLESPYAENILRDMDSDGRMGLKSAPDELLNRARERTRGYPRALEALFAILASDRYTSLEELLEKPTPENVVQELVGEAFNRLDTNAQKVMQALAVYNRPVTPAAVDYLLAPHIPAIDSAPILQRLANMHFARKESGRFYLHPVDREFAFGLIPEKDLTMENTESTEIFEEEEDLIRVEPDDVIPASDEIENDADDSDIDFESIFSSWRASQHNAFTKYDLTIRAADYFAQARKPRAKWKKLDDLSAQLAEFDLRCAAGDYDTAASVLIDFDRAYLSLWGHYRLMISLHEKIFDSITDKHLRMHILNGLETAYRNMGNAKKAIIYLEQGLNIAKESKSREAESVFLGNLGVAYFDLGEAHKAVEFYEGALVIAREIGDRQNEGNWLGNLGLAYANLGDARKAVEFYEGSLAISREVGNRRGEGSALNNLGNAYADLGNAHKAVEFYEGVLVISREIGNRRGEGAALDNLGNAYADLGDVRKAIEFYEGAFVISREIGDRQGESIELENLGHVFLIREEYHKSEEKYQQAIQIADEISLPMVQLNARWGLAKAYVFQNDLVNAYAAIEASLQYDEPRYNHNASALHGIIALRQGDEVTARGAFVRAIGQADEILSKTAEYYDALDAKGLSIAGLLICDFRLGRGAVSAPKGDASTTGRGDPAPTVDDAIETFRKARKIAPHAGVVKRNLRLFDELMKCEGGEILKDVRNAVEGK